MNFLQHIVANLAGSVGLQASVGRDDSDPRWWGAAAIQTMAGQSVTSQSALRLGMSQAVLEALAGPVSSLPLMVFERVEGGGRKVASDHPLYELLHDQPNAEQTAQEFRDEQARHLAWYRNAYARIVPGENAVSELEQIHPDRVTNVERGTDGWIYYTVRRLAPRMGHDVLRQDEIWHIRKAPLTVDGLRGRPIFETAIETFAYAQAVHQFGSLYFANGGSGGGTIEHPGKFKDKDEQRDFLDAWRDGGAGLNRHKDRLLLFGLKYQQFKVDNDEAQFNESKREANYALAALWNMPPHRVGMLDKATNNNIEHQSLEYVTYTLGPLITGVEQSARRDLLIGSDRQQFFVEHNVAGLLRGDIRTRWAAYAQGRQWGWLSINDIRRLENMNPIAEGGDEYLHPLNMVPAGTIPAPTDERDSPPKEGQANVDA